MKIGILTYSYDWYRKKTSGGPRYIKNLVLAMKEIKKDVLCLIHSQKINDELYEDIDEVRLEGLSPLTSPFRIYKIPKLLRLLREYDVRLIHATDPRPLVNLHLTLPGFKKVLTVHDLRPFLKMKVFGKGPTGELRTTLWKLSFLAIKDEVDNYIAVSENTQKDLNRILGIPSEQIKVIYEAPAKVFRVLEKKDSPIGHPYILTDRISFLETYAKLRRRGIEQKLVILGDPPKECRSSRDVIFTGYVSDEELCKLYNNADLFVYPTKYEGFGFLPIEAMTCGCPVVASKVASLKEIVGDAGILLPPDDFERWLTAIYDLLRDEKLRERMAKRGLERSREFSWERAAKETFELYEKSLGCRII